MTGMAEVEVSPQEEMANPQGMKMFSIKRYGLPKDFVLFRALCGVQSFATPICAESVDCLGPATVVGTGRDSVLQICTLLS